MNLEIFDIKIKTREVSKLSIETSNYTLETDFLQIPISFDSFYKIHSFKLNPNIFHNLISQILLTEGYVLISKTKLTVGARSVFGHFETSLGKFFLKLTECNANEVTGNIKLSNYYQTVPILKTVNLNKMSLIIQPFISQKNLMSYKIDGLEKAQSSDIDLESFRQLFEIFLRTTQDTLFFGIEQGKNDKFFYDRLLNSKDDKARGRIEEFYENSICYFGIDAIDWEKLLNLNFTINGINFKNNLKYHLDEAKKILNPANFRLLAFGHGDFHEANIILNDDSVIFMDTETCGINSVMQEIAIFIVYLSMFGNYILPKYELKNTEINALRIQKSLIINSLNQNKINISDVEKLKCSKVRKSILKLYLEVYVKPLRQTIKLRYKQSNNFEKDLKYAIFMRLIAVFNLNKFDAQDQLRFFCTIFQVLEFSGDIIENIEKMF